MRFNLRSSARAKPQSARVEPVDPAGFTAAAAAFQDPIQSARRMRLSPRINHAAIDRCVCGHAQGMMRQRHRVTLGDDRGAAVRSLADR